MRLKIIGAAGEVTGSSYLLECGASRVLVDCGIFQGKEDDRKNREPFSFSPVSLDAVLLTHAHMDHSGRIPLLVKEGFKGKVFATLPTLELVKVLWYDSANLMKEEAEWKTKKNSRKGLEEVEPLYSAEHVDQSIRHLSASSYDDKIEVAPGIFVRFRDAGHILGSAILEIWLVEGEKEVKIVFSGDLGPQKTVMERNPAIISSADYVVMESTYGDRLHKSNEETRAEFRSVFEKVLKDKGKVFIPSFVVDRAQRVLYELALLQDQGILGSNVPIFFDSPMGVKATEIYKKHTNLLSSEIQQYISEGKDPFSPGKLKYVSSVEDSRAINGVKHAVVVAGSGMINGGRIVHHLKHGIWDPNNHLVFVGYQAKGTMGRRIIEGEKNIRIAGEEVSVKAELHTINGFSAHADRDDLLAWASNFTNSPFFLITHGEPESSLAFSETLKKAGMKSAVPTAGQELELEPNGAAKAPKIIEQPVMLRVEDMSSVLSEILTLVSGMKDGRPAASEEDILPLLQSSKILLETAKKKMSEKKV
ncbi:MAG: MBL fold metallo-hydrolase [Synergistaceae bacterium]|jgi:metallo-beta-lactamase family protein|uniref:MBL fold metallo-hydrolase RNA specificity domain-containing protein n=1 Tax=Aminivibrio sp. TaxID=1872489 RepID=UPI002A195E8A|nr:MBL fold metallo-hydrolase [Synergistaceae bacterium]MDD3389801.1 MBL fold metallo-hydrolase [Synergistaceae bacterium]MDD3689021.1 MBL fold metallo-hydrolase [Synergistaceae bacterium]MDD4021156.1 MBL fold metallo-hydrolase [Synergistaceae bacterium]MDD4611899.1 MBL fold metallo-hydrolase [Synergistaceae bacterium]